MAGLQRLVELVVQYSVGKLTTFHGFRTLLQLWLLIGRLY